MKIRSLMVPDPITINEGASIEDAIDLMKVNSIRHLPVVGAQHRLVGLVTLADLKQGLIPAIMGEASLADLIIRQPITADPDDDIEIAAQLIYKHKISGMPVAKGGRLLGIITESDILRAFIDMMGILTASSRIDVEIGESRRMFQQVLEIINENGGDIINVGMTTRQGSKREYYFRLALCNTKTIKEALEAAGFKVLSAMD